MATKELTFVEVRPIETTQDIADVIQHAIDSLTFATGRPGHFPTKLAVAELRSVLRFLGIDYEDPDWDFPVACDEH